MPWCPKCKNEYREGVTHCADCGAMLVEELTGGEKTAVLFGEEQQMQSLLEFCQYNGIQSAELRDDETSDMKELFVETKEEERARKLIQVFQKELAEKSDSQENTETAAASSVKSAGIYSAKSERAVDMKSSALTLLLVGVLGVILLVLNWFGIVPIVVSPYRKYMITGVMGVLFLLFIVIGILSVKSYRKLRSEGEEEKNREQEIMEWCRNHLRAAELDDELFANEESSEEQKYFMRTERIKELITGNYPGLEEGFLDKLTDDFYPELFG